MLDKKNNNNKSTGDSDRVLIPVDFSPKGSLALNVGFELARRLGKKVTLIHASVIANPNLFPQFPDDFNGMDNEDAEIEEMELEQEISTIDHDSMAKLKKHLNSLKNQGLLPDIEYDSIIAPGTPEEVIAEFCAMTPPAVIVMATRGKQKRQEELIGSVTAEVIDHCLAPVFTVPEHFTFSGFKEIVRICAFCNFDEGDVETVKRLMEMFDNPKVKIFLFPASHKMKGAQRAEALEKIKNKLQNDYPNAEFFIDAATEGNNLRQQIEALFVKEDIQMILAPNRKRNALSRFLNPGLAHKILYETDFPILDIPV